VDFTANIRDEKATHSRMYDIGNLEFRLVTMFGVSLHVRGVMYRPKQYGKRSPRDGSIVLQDALGDYYFYQEDGRGSPEVVTKFRAPRGTTPRSFVKKYFEGAHEGVDMDEVLPRWDDNLHTRLQKEQANLAGLRIKAKRESACACAKLNVDEPVNSKFL
jgi:hypothetical protein